MILFSLFGLLATTAAFFFRAAGVNPLRAVTNGLENLIRTFYCSYLISTLVFGCFKEATTIYQVIESNLMM
jgi:hypothetical protein